MNLESDKFSNVINNIYLSVAVLLNVVLAYAIWYYSSPLVFWIITITVILTLLVVNKFTGLYVDNTIVLILFIFSLTFMVLTLLSTIDYNQLYITSKEVITFLLKK